MSHLPLLTRFVGCTLFALALGSACGGKSFVGADDDDGGSSTGATSSQAGSRPTAGKPSSGGVPGAGGTTGTGATATGGTTGSAGTISLGGTGGALGEACSAPSDPGPCLAAGRAWYHDASTGVCRPFVYGGCGGNTNRYGSLEACQMACRGSGPNYDSCTVPSDCMVTGNSCCGVCDTAGLTKHDFVAYNKKYQGLQCGSVPGDAPAIDIGCPGCPESQGGFLEYFVPDCVHNECVVVDLRDPQFTACKTHEECSFRYGTGCCQSCNSADAIPLRKDANIEPLVCAGTGPVACAPCPPIEPKLAPVPNCNSENRCELNYIAF